MLLRTFLLVSLLIFVSVATWLTLFGLAEREPRARQLALLAVKTDVTEELDRLTAHIAAALDTLAIPHSPGTLPMRPSEDFGAFGKLPQCKAAMVMLGAGLHHAALHNPDYDFPDDLIPIGTQIFRHIARDLLG